PDGKNGVDYRAGEGDGFNARVGAALHMDGRSADRRTIADDSADPSSGRIPGWATAELTDLAGIGDREAGHTPGGSARGPGISTGGEGGPVCPDECVCMGGECNGGKTCNEDKHGGVFKPHRRAP